LILGAALLIGVAAAQSPRLVIGVVSDGPGAGAPRIDEFRDEITRLLGSDYAVEFPSAKTQTGDWSAASVEGALDRLFLDPEVDVVLALGVLSSNAAARRPTLPKTTLAPYVIDPELQGIPQELRRGAPTGGDVQRSYSVSGRENLVYVAIGHDALGDIEAFREVVPFRRLAVLAMDSLLQGVPGLEERFRARVAPLQLDVAVVPVRDSLEDAVARISTDAEAVYVTPLMQFAAGGVERLSRLLIERKLPSFSTVGRKEVLEGLLVGRALDTDVSRLARRSAINLQLILGGARAAELPVDFDHSERLTLNMATARAIDARLTWSTLTEAELLQDTERPLERRISLGDVVQEAERANLDLAAADRTVASGLQDVRLARSNLLPQLEASGQDVVIDRDRASSSFGSMGQNQVSGSLTFTQLLYSEQARAGYFAEQRLQEARERERATLRLDVILEAAQTYLDVLRAKTAERIRRDNLELTRRNLERARTRLELGAAGPGEVYRWQSQIANNRKDLIAASAVRNQAEIALNRVLNRPLEEGFSTVEASLDDPDLAFNYESLRPFIDNRQGFALFRRFVTGEALEASPELSRLDRYIEAQNRQILATKRAFYVPTVGAQADLTGFKNSGPGSSNPLIDIAPPEIELTQPNNLNWSVGVSASLPLFQGGALRARRTQAEIDLDELTIQREAARQRVEQRVRSAMHATMASWAGIDLARQAAEAARNNFELVADAYGEGLVDIINLLDAQNQALTADLAAATAVYDFLYDLMGVQRASGEFDFFRSPDDRARFLDQMRIFFEENGYVP
jgi:outer membrane protein TolC